MKDESNYVPLRIETLEVDGLSVAKRAMRLPMEGKKPKTSDIELARGLVGAGGPNAKFSRGIIVYYEAWFQIGWMVEFDTYRIGREVMSTSSTMHNELSQMCGAELANAKQALAPSKVYHQIGYISYPTLGEIYKWRRPHRHPDWQIFCNWIETLPYYMPLILGREE